MSEIESKKQTLSNITDAYIALLARAKARDGTPEFEIRFGTGRGMRRITRLDYDSIIRRLRSAGFDITEQQSYLRINSEYTDAKTGLTKISRVRAELSGLGDIAEYCRTNSIENFYNTKRVRFIEKAPVRNEILDDKSGSTQYIDIPIYDANNFNFRAALSMEKNVTFTKLTRGVVDSWKDLKKTFRYITRHRLTSPSGIIAVDVSIVKESARSGRYMKPTYTFEEARVSQGIESYEIEIEVNNNMVGVATEYETVESLLPELKSGIMLILSGLQGTNYPVSYVERSNIMNDYMKVLWGKDWEGRIYPKHFVGPSSFTLQTANIATVNDDSIIPNIRNDYTVTDKADGERKLLFVAPNKRIYMIDTNMNAQFTGAICSDEALINTIADGEHIPHNKQGKFINLYAAFDLYYLGGKDIRAAPFLPENGGAPNTARYTLLQKMLEGLKPVGLTKDSPSPLRIEAKEFYATSNDVSIFQACAHLLSRVESLEYETDGLIFTPAYLGVGSNKRGETTKPQKRTWDYSFKWKPIEQNTIDFLVTIQRDTDGREQIKSMFESGTDMGTATQITQYKTAILRVGFDEAIHGYINPCLDVINGKLPVQKEQDEDDGYRPVQFYPSNPTDNQAGICNLLLESAEAGEKVLFTEARQVIEDNMIVEFRYEVNRPQGWKWVPLRVRYDKTADLRSGGKNYGNAYHVANSNWHTIHNPITVEMISTGLNIPNELGDDDVYYNLVVGSTSTRSLRDFHNLYVKRKLILSTAHKGGTLIDLSVGKGGDLPKWIAAKQRFVFGIDISQDNIENRLDGVCARYLNYTKKFNKMPGGLFVTGDSSVNIRSTDAIITDKGKRITKAVFGEGPKDAKELGAGVYKYYGIGASGFDVCSIQFAIHYMFENPKAFNNLLRNVSEVTKVGGYFIGTCYDGNSVFSMLENKQVNESVDLYDENGAKIWEITKRYTANIFKPDVSSLGYAVDVYQESINKSFREYLVNFEYLDRMIENYGFVRLTREQAKTLKLPGVSGHFRELYGEMRSEIAKNPRIANEYGLANEMTPNEQTISFLNRYFIYVKTHAVDAKSVAAQMMGQSRAEYEVEENATEDATQIIKDTQVEETIKIKKPRKLKKKLVLK